MDINIRELGVKISNEVLNIKDSIINVRDLRHLNNIIAECDDITKNIIKEAFKKSKSKTSFVESIGGLIDEYGKKLDFSTVTGPEIHSMDIEEEKKEEVKEEFNIDDIVDQYSTKGDTSDADSLIDDILKNYSTVEKNVSNEVSDDVIDSIINQYATPVDDKKEDNSTSTMQENVYEVNESGNENTQEIVINQADISNDLDVSEVKQNTDYVVDPSYENKPLIERLQDINSEGPIFIDEERIEDKTLNVSNAISLGKINTRPLVVRDEPMKVDVSKNTILEMSENLCDTFKKACDRVKEKISKFSIKGALNVLSSTANKAGTFIAEMPRELSYKISEGSKRLRKAKIIKSEELSSKREQLIDQLKEIKQSYVDGYNEIEQEEVAKGM